ncbi:hypothetical protein LY78DRAFT_637519 [Colletotrichum sublineola]|nr:hypothetical protein LY78DRAFT_637519 [Colletotrichum sublineola]
MRPSKMSNPVDLEMGCQTTEGLQERNRIEDYRAGYPRFAALLAANDSFFVFRRFSRLRARILLLKQDRLSVLEEKLDQLDEHEESPLFLGKSRCDKNEARRALLQEMESCLADYDAFTDRTHRALALSVAEPRDIISLQNWVENSSSLSRNETEYLEVTPDLVTLSSSKDSALELLEGWVEDVLIRYYRGFRKGPLHDRSNDSNVYIYSGTLVKQTARAVMLCLITSLILIPVIICIAVNSVVARVAIILLSTVLYLSILSRLTSAKMMELILAGATFATVLTVFVSGDNAPGG